MTQKRSGPWSDRRRSSGRLQETKVPRTDAGARLLAFEDCAPVPRVTGGLASFSEGVAGHADQDPLVIPTDRSESGRLSTPT